MTKYKIVVVRGSGLCSWLRTGKTSFLTSQNLSRYGSRIVPGMILGHFVSVKHILNNFRVSKVIFVIVLDS